MPFIVQTRLVQTTVVPPVDRARFAGTVYDVPEAMSYVAPAQRPPVAQYGAYALVYDLRCAVTVNPSGVLPDTDGHLLVLYDAWDTPAAASAGVPPVLRNSHELGLPPGQDAAALQAQIAAAIRDYLVRASLRGWTGDQRDPGHAARATRTDPTGEFAKLAGLADVQVIIDTAVTDPSPAPLLTMVPK